MKKSGFIKTMALFSLLALIVSALSSCTKRETPAEDFVWEDREGRIVITGYNGTAKHIVVPEIINNKKVRSVEKTFVGNVVVQSIVLPSGCSEINLSLCENLKKVTLLTSDTISEYSVRLPNMAEVLNAPNASALSGYKYSTFSNLQVLNLPSATTVSMILSKDEWSDKPLTVTLSKELCYYYISPSGTSATVSAEKITNTYYAPEQIPEGLTYTYDEVTNRYLVDIGQELTSDVAAEVFCTLFNRTTVVVNGTTYTMPER
ncbi:MAG: hypothetical protein J6M12_03535 [Clostridia bacterium]|nr:hypothetical protein [Clostridia bacterium]